jgi:hypothetical protein
MLPHYCTLLPLLLCIVHLLAVRSITNKDQKLSQLLSIIKTPMIFTMSFMLLWVILIATQINIDANRGEFLEGFTDWATCIFKNFGTGNQSDVNKKCGSHPR